MALMTAFGMRPPKGRGACRGYRPFNAGILISEHTLFYRGQANLAHAPGDGQGYVVVEAVD